MSAEHQPVSRLFFALTPDPATAQKLHALAVSSAPRGARVVPPENIHLTLLFLGNTEPERERCLLEMAEGIEGAPVSPLFEHIGSWRRSQVMWSAPDITPALLLELVGELKKGAIVCGLSPEQRPYRPHITLARRVRRRVQIGSHPPIEWRAKDFQLLASIPVDGGVRYEIRGRWLLAGGKHGTLGAGC